MKLFLLLLFLVPVQARPTFLTGFARNPSKLPQGSESNFKPCFAERTKRSSGGFGSATKEATGQLSNKAKKLLKQHGNNVDAASSAYFQSQMESRAHDGGIEEMHEARVAATWNTIAMFLPQGYARTKGKVEAFVERRLRYVAAACRGDLAIDLLDVGCGDGAIISYLCNKCRFNGMDLSSEMIELGKQRYPRSNLWVGGFPRSVPAGSTYDAILFNGSLQFFRDTRRTLEHAANMLNPGGRIILSHVNGGIFVADECKKNPSLAVRNMPNKVNLNTMAQLLGLTIADKQTLLAGHDFNPDLDGANDDFYLVILEKPEY